MDEMKIQDLHTENAGQQLLLTGFQDMGSESNNNKREEATTSSRKPCTVAVSRIWWFSLPVCSF